MILVKSISFKDQVQIPKFTKAKFVSVHNSFMSYRIFIILRKIVVHAPRLCHDIDSRSYLQGQGNRTHITEIRALTINCPCHVGSR